MDAPQASSLKFAIYAPWVLGALLAVAFGLSGSQKVVGTLAAEGAEHFGYSVGFMRFIGVCEVAGAIGLLIPRLSMWSASGLIVIMVGAVFSHATHDPIAQAVPAAVLLVLLVVLARVRRDRALFLAS